MARTHSSLVPTAGIVSSPFGILSPATSTYEYDTGHWTSGITYAIEDAGVVVKLGSIVGATPIKSVSVINNSAETDRYDQYYPFDIQASVKLSTFGVNPEDIEKNVTNALDIVTQKALEIEFWEGKAAQLLTVENDNRYLASDVSKDVTPNPGTGVKPRQGQALLEQAIAKSPLGGLGVLHAPKLVASTLKVKPEGKTLKTNLGTPVVAGTGYSTLGPDGQPAPAGMAWMYATGPVTVHLGTTTVTPPQLSQAVNTKVNTIEYFVSRPAAITWATRDSYAVLIDLSLDYA